MNKSSASSVDCSNGQTFSQNLLIRRCRGGDPGGGQDTAVGRLLAALTVQLFQEIANLSEVELIHSIHLLPDQLFDRWIGFFAVGGGLPVLRLKQGYAVAGNNF